VKVHGQIQRSELTLTYIVITVLVRTAEAVVNVENNYLHDLQIIESSDMMCGGVKA